MSQTSDEHRSLRKFAEIFYFACQNTSQIRDVTGPLGATEHASIAKQRLERALVAVSTALEEQLAFDAASDVEVRQLRINWNKGAALWVPEGLDYFPIQNLFRRAVANGAELQDTRVMEVVAEVLTKGLRIGVLILPNFQRTHESTDSCAVFELLSANRPFTSQ